MQTQKGACMDTYGRDISKPTVFVVCAQHASVQGQSIRKILHWLRYFVLFIVRVVVGCLRCNNVGWVRVG